MRYVEHEDKLFRVIDPSNTSPAEVWSPSESRFVPYQGHAPKQAAGGKVITPEEAEADMRDSQQLVGSIPHRLLDGYDGGQSPSPEYIEELLKHAPPWIKDRLNEVAQEQTTKKEKQ